MTMTITARPTPPRIKDPLDAVMRSCLRDEDVWSEVVGTAAGLNQAEHWLKTTAASIDQQLSYRQDEVEIWRLAPQEHSASLTEYLEWRKGALYLKSLCEKCLIDAKRLRAADESRAQEMKALLLRLADAVLDEIRLPGEDAPTLRDYIVLRDGVQD
ncbi:MAG: hypothetical protein Q4C81_04325 [Kocuria sp.]|nr:hypothetical protein [Kocuria sp.]